MKKIVAIAIFFLLVEDLLVAQDSDLRLGFQVSPVFAGMSTDDNKINGNGTNLGLKLGMVSEFFFRENYAFILGLGFAFNSGGTLRHEALGEYWQKTELPGTVTSPFPAGTDLKYNLQYVEIPIGLKFRTKEFGYLRYYAEIPVITLGFKSQARGGIEYSGINEEKIDIKKEVTALALSWGLGGGVEYSISESTAIIGGIGYQQVFTDVTKDYGGGIDSKARINNFIIRLGVMF
jgi:opacity protein-like surface antigen